MQDISMILKTTVGQRSRITEKQRQRHAFFKLIIVGGLILLVFLL